MLSVTLTEVFRTGMAFASGLGCCVVLAVGTSGEFTWPASDGGDRRSLLGLSLWLGRSLCLGLCLDKARPPKSCQCQEETSD